MKRQPLSGNEILAPAGGPGRGYRSGPGDPLHLYMPSGPSMVGVPEGTHGEVCRETLDLPLHPPGDILLRQREAEGDAPLSG